ncbi:hypothetical protein WDW86_08565 [Bdellovibrionota bacterium FG-2]
MKPQKISVLALGLVAFQSIVGSAFGATPKNPENGIYAHQRIDWRRDGGRELALPMRCDDIVYRAISFSVPGALGRDFVVRTTGSACQVIAATFDAQKRETKIVVENEDYCTVSLDQLEQNQIQSIFVFQLFDAC